MIAILQLVRRSASGLPRETIPELRAGGRAVKGGMTSRAPDPGAKGGSGRGIGFPRSLFNGVFAAHRNSAAQKMCGKLLFKQIIIHSHPRHYGSI
jgi:hypothetical protein